MVVNGQKHAKLELESVRKMGILPVSAGSSVSSGEAESLGDDATAEQAFDVLEHLVSEL